MSGSRACARCSRSCASAGEELEKRDLGGVYDDIADQLDEILDQERAGIERRLQDARDSGDQRRKEITEDLAQARQMELELMPPDLAGRVQAMQEYDFMDDARQRFEELMDELRQQLMQSYFNQMSEGMQDVSPEQMARMKDMLAELNQMLEQRERGEEPDFEGFMERYGDFFPGTPRPSTSCSSRWRVRWPRCSRCSTR